MRPLQHALVRAFLALLALLSTAAPAAAAVGEGVLATRAGQASVAMHAEDSRHARCPYVHADDCALCAVAAAHALPGTVRTADAPATTACRAAELPEAGGSTAQRSIAARHARGPPTG